MLPRPLQVIPALAVANLRHEWILNLCLVIALAAVIAPLLVLLGLKHGTIETLRQQLVQDPVFRELRPAQTREYLPEWFAEVQDWPGVGFVTPTILPLSSVVQVALPGQRSSELFDLIPTAAGDPLLLENRVAIPAADAVVLTAAAAQRLGLSVGDSISLEATRAREGRSERAQALFRVSGILPVRAGSLPRIYTSLEFVLDVEAYKEGYGSAQRGWPGSTPEPFLSFDGAVLLMSEPLTPIAYTGLIINTGFGRITEPQPEDVNALLGWTPPAALTAYQLFSPGTTVTVANLRAIEQKLRGQSYVLLPYVQGVELSTAGGVPLALIGLSIDPSQAALLQLPASPWGRLNLNQPNLADTQRLRSVLLPSHEVAADSDASLNVISSGVTTLTFPLIPQGQSPLPQAIVPVELLGVLRTAKQRAVEYDAITERFTLARSGYRGFRLYAERIDDVPGLFERLRQQGVEVLAEVEAIERIQVLDAGLSRLFWLIALLGISGGTAVLVVSLYAAVERRRRDLGVLRLIGLARVHVFCMPLVQGVVLAGLGLAAGFAAYASLALVINFTFAEQLAAGQRFCTLPLEQGLAAVLLTLGLSVIAALAAAWRTTLIDPAEVLREQ